VRRALPWLAAAAGLLLAAALAIAARRANGFDGFPLDDAWIHLTFARTLAETGRFAYVPGDPLSSGSTSPLFTALLALGFLVTSSEKLLGLGVGLACHGGFLAALAWWARARGATPGAAAAAVLLCAVDPRLAPLAVSGMETSLFLLAIAIVFAAYAAERETLAAAALGVACWVRPEALILAAVLAIDRGLARRRPGVAAVVALGAPVVAYVAFNLAVGGRWLPSTFAAKTAYYGGLARGTFARTDVWPLLGTGAWLIAAPFIVAGVVRAVRSPSVRAEAGWLLALPAAYAVLLPFGHRFDRYLVPVLPAAAVIAATTARTLLERVPARRAVTAALLVVAAALALPAARAGARSYVELCRYHRVRHEAAGRWLATNTPPGAVVATHDIGAIAFYSRRRIVDVAGLVLDEAIAHLRDADPTPYLADLFDRRGVTHVAALRNWLEVDDVEPLFVADPAPEILEIYPWVPGRTHLVPKAASRLEQDGVARLVAGDAEAATAILDRAIEADPRSARIRLLSGNAYAMARRLDLAEAAYRQAVALGPDLGEPRYRLATVLATTGRREEARALAAELRREGKQRSIPRLAEFEAALGAP